VTDLPRGGPALPQERRLRTEIPGPRAKELHARRGAAVAAGVSSMLPVYVTAAGGGVLVDVDDNSLIDLGAGIAVVNVGNAAAEVAAAVAAQAAAFTHTCFMVTPYEGYVAVCEQLNRLTPGDHDKRSLLVNSGAEAVENAVKIARHHTGRDAVVVLDHAYHGRTNLTMAMTAKSRPYKHRFGPFAGEVYRVPGSYPFREPVPVSGEEAAHRAIGVIETQVGAGNVACVVVEPIQGEGGYLVPEDGFLPGLRDLCDRHGILLIADEIQSGVGRTGAMWAVDLWDVKPDVLLTAKGLASGMPIAAMVARADLVEKWGAGAHGSTYGGNPVACAAALAALRTLQEEDLAGRARQIEALMLPRLQELARRHPQVGEVRGRGAMLAVEVVRPGGTVPDAALTAAVSGHCHRHGVVTLTCGTFGNVLRFLPPLVIPEHLLLEALDVLDDAFATHAG